MNDPLNDKVQVMQQQAQNLQQNPIQPQVNPNMNPYSNGTGSARPNVPQTAFDNINQFNQGMPMSQNYGSSAFLGIGKKKPVASDFFKSSSEK